MGNFVYKEIRTLPGVIVLMGKFEYR